MIEDVRASGCGHRRDDTVVLVRQRMSLRGLQIPKIIVLYYVLVLFSSLIAVDASEEAVTLLQSHAHDSDETDLKESDGQVLCRGGGVEWPAANEDNVTVLEGDYEIESDIYGVTIRCNGSLTLADSARLCCSKYILSRMNAGFIRVSWAHSTICPTDKCSSKQTRASQEIGRASCRERV